MDDPEPGDPGEGDEPDATEFGDDAGPVYERPIDKFRRTVAGTAIAAGMFGLRDALEGRPEREEPVMEVPARGSVIDDDLDVVVDLAHPENSRIVVRRSAEPPNPS
ncbi:MAG TPA: hypothetical protein VFC99_20705 [Acidimicrobiia bacterium]|nr:hypothetical protein [Acidimicrobiia bacterium]